MINIKKEKEPSSLTQYKQQLDASFDGANFTPVKNDIRNQLLEEQGYLCAYCMQRLENDCLKVKIEHWHCQDNYPEEQLEYKNMLAVCLGNQGNPIEKQHCDTLKGNKDLIYHPANPQHNIEDKIKYLGDGTIRSDDMTLNKELDTVLNLNYFMLKQNRKEVLNSIFKALNCEKGTRTKIELRKILEKWLNKNQQGKFEEYCGVAIYYIKKKI